MYVMTGELIFPDIKLQDGSELIIRHFQEVHIERTFKQFTQFAEVLIPRGVFRYFNRSLKEVIKIGHRVVIKLGYDGNNVEEFRGYVTRINPGIPVFLRIEDEMWRASKLGVNYVGSNLMLSDLLKKLAVGYEVDALEVKIGDVRFSQTNLGAVLEKLESEWKLYSYFRDGKLICGKYYSEDTGVEAITEKVSDKICNCIKSEIRLYSEIKPEINRCYDNIFNIADSSEQKILFQQGALDKVKNGIIPTLNERCEKVKK